MSLPGGVYIDFLIYGEAQDFMSEVLQLRANGMGYAGRYHRYECPECAFKVQLWRDALVDTCWSAERHIRFHHCRKPLSHEPGCSRQVDLRALLASRNNVGSIDDLSWFPALRYFPGMTGPR